MNSSPNCEAKHEHCRCYLISSSPHMPFANVTDSSAAIAVFTGNISAILWFSTRVSPDRENDVADDVPTTVKRLNLVSLAAASTV